MARRSAAGLDLPGYVLGDYCREVPVTSTGGLTPVSEKRDPESAVFTLPPMRGPGGCPGSARASLAKRRHECDALTG